MLNGSPARSGRSGLSAPTPRPQQQEPPPHHPQQNDGADHDHWRQPRLLLLRRAGADPDHHASYLGASARFGSPHSVAVGVEDEFALGIGMAGFDRRLQITGREYPDRGVGQRLAGRSRELGGDLVGGKGVEAKGG